MRTFQISSMACLAVCSVILTGCGPKPAADVTPNDTGDIHDHDQAHPHEGPHHGSLVELGDEEYHAEVVHDAGSVTVYVLDSSAQTAVPIDAEELTINVMQSGAPKQFALAASPEASDGPGQSSRFVSKDAELVGYLDDDSAAPQLSLTIEGTSFQGAIEHDHDHEGHDH